MLEFVAVDNDSERLSQLEIMLKKENPGCIVTSFRDPMLSAKYILNNDIDQVFTQEIMERVTGEVLKRVININKPNLRVSIYREIQNVILPESFTDEKNTNVRKKSMLSQKELEAWRKIFPETVNPFGRGKDMPSSLYQIRTGQAGTSDITPSSFTDEVKYDALKIELQLGAKVYVYEGMEEKPSYILSLNKETNLPQLSEKLVLREVEKPSGWKQFWHWITGGKAYKQDYEQYNKDKALDNEIKKVGEERSQGIKSYSEKKQELENEAKLNKDNPEYAKRMILEREKDAHSVEFKRDKEVMKGIIGLSNNGIGLAEKGVDDFCSKKTQVLDADNRFRKAVESMTWRPVTNDKKLITKLADDLNAEAQRIWKGYTGESGGTQLKQITDSITDGVNNILKYTEVGIKKYPEVMIECGKRLEKLEEMLERRPVLSEAVKQSGYRQKEVKDFISGAKKIEQMKNENENDIDKAFELKPEQLKETIAKNILLGVVLGENGPKGQTLSETLDSLGSNKGKELMDKIQKSSWVEKMESRMQNGKIHTAFDFEKEMKHTENKVIQELAKNSKREKSAEKVAENIVEKQKKAVDVAKKI